MDKDSRIYVAGADKMIGAAIVRNLEVRGFTHILGRQEYVPDLTDSTSVRNFFVTYRPDFVFLTAGKSGGIVANQRYPADLIYDNLMTECNVIHSAQEYGVRKLLYLASSCVYPRHCPQPMQPSSLMTGKLEPTNESYALAKLAGLQLCAAYREQFESPFICAIPADVFGPMADFGLQDSHVIPALIYKMHMAREEGIGAVELWGTGKPRREFVYADDMADACVFVMMNYYSTEIINLGGGKSILIEDLARSIKDVVDYQGELVFNTDMSDGMPVKGLDASRLLDMGWRPQVDFRSALVSTYEWFLKNRRYSLSDVG